MTRLDPSRFSALQRGNSELAVRALRRGAGFAFHRPTQVYLQIASACNLACTMCSEYNRPEDARFGKGLVSLAPEIFARLEREVFPWSSELYLGVGGEPTFSEHFVDYVERAARAGQEVHLVTNGTYLERDAIAHAVAGHVDFAQVSIDAATAETYERIRLGSRWKRLMAGLERLAELRRRAPAGRECHLSLCFVLMRSNADELPAFVELAARLGADAVHAQHVIPITEPSAGESLAGEPARWDALRAESVARARALGVELELPAPFGAPPEPAPVDRDLAAHAVPCRSPSQTLVVLYDGRVFACCHPLAHAKMQLGDLRTQSFEQVWNGRAARNLRVGIRTGDAPAICRGCSIVHSPPPAAEVSGELATSPDLAAHYGARDLEPLPDAARSRAALAEYLGDLRAHADALASETAGLAAHAAALAAERDGLARHVANLARERAPLVEHAANLEVERAHAHAHATRLEARLARRGFRGWLAGLVRPGRAGARETPAREDG